MYTSLFTISERTVTKSRDEISDFTNGQASKPYRKRGICLLFKSCNTTSSSYNSVFLGIQPLSYYVQTGAWLWERYCSVVSVCPVQLGLWLELPRSVRVDHVHGWIPHWSHHMRCCLRQVSMYHVFKSFRNVRISPFYVNDVKPQNKE